MYDERVQYTGNNINVTNVHKNARDNKIRTNEHNTRIIRTQ